MATAQAFVITFKPILDMLFQDVLAPVVTGAVGWLVLKALQWLHVSTTSIVAQRIVTAAENGAALALSKASTLADQAQVSTKSQLVATALSYVNTAVPDAIKAQGLDTAAGQAHLANMVEAKLQQATSAPIAVTSEAPVITPFIGANPWPASPAL